jgi:molybdopterin/thiamine biosynthesis adenylyltransferase
VLLDDDEVDRTNLHRQILFSEADVGHPKAERAKQRLERDGARSGQVVARLERFLPDNATALLEGVDVILEGADNFATKFLVADAAYLAGVPVVHGAAVGWRATVLSVAPEGRPCYRCLFEDLPQGAVQNCDTAGVIGPVVGFAGALMADRALCLLGAAQAPGSSAQLGRVVSYDGRLDSLREVAVSPRKDCPLCGQTRAISDIDEGRYTGATCSA